MKKEWKNVLAVLGIFLLAAAVALMPACETGGGDGINACEAAVGDWSMDIVKADYTGCGGEDMSGLGKLVNIAVSGSEVTIDPEDGDLMPGEIVCEGAKFTITILYKIMIPSCTAEQGILMSGTFSSADKFTGTMTFYKSHEGTGEPCDSWGDDCEDVYTVTGTRI